MGYPEAYKSLEYWSCLRKYYELHKAGKVIRYSDLPHLTNKNNLFIKGDLKIQSDNDIIALKKMETIYSYCRSKNNDENKSDKKVLNYFYEVLHIKDKDDKIKKQKEKELKKREKIEIEKQIDKQKRLEISLKKKEELKLVTNQRNRDRALHHARDPKEYYYKRFPSQLKKVAGTTIHKHYDDAWYISMRELDDQKFSILPIGDQLPFMYCLAFTVLLDQVMYSHFKDKYETFYALTLYPKVEIGTTSIHVNPWRIIKRQGAPKLFEDFCRFFIEDASSFFESNAVKGVTWKDVANAMINDKDVETSIFGNIFVKILNEK